LSVDIFKPDYRILIGAAVITRDVLDVAIDVVMNTSSEPDLLKITIYNIDTIIQSFVFKGAVISVSMGYSNGVMGQVITAVVTKHYYDFVNGEEVAVIEAIDKTVYDLKETRINLSLNTVTDIADIVNRICLLSGVACVVSPTGVSLETYTVEDTSAFEVLIDLAERIGYNVTAKGSLLYFSPRISSNIIGAVITDDMGFKFREVVGSSYDGSQEARGYYFEGSGLPTILPARLINLALPSRNVVGSFLVESVVHRYTPDESYTCVGNLVEPDATIAQVASIQFPTEKTIAKSVRSLVDSRINAKREIEVGEVDQAISAERVATAAIGIDPTAIQGTVIPSIEATIKKDSFVNRKPISSIFAGDGFGLVSPIYEGARPLIAFPRGDSQDAVLLSFLWRRGWVIPEHDDGDYMLHHINHSKEVHKEDGHLIQQVKGLRIQIGNAGLTVSKPTATGDGELSVEFDDGSSLVYTASGWVLNASSIKLGSGATLGGARLTDPTLSDLTTDPAFWAWLVGFVGVFQAWVPVPADGGLVLKTALTTWLTANPTPTSQAGKINGASSKVSVE